VGGHDEVQTVDSEGKPNGTALAKQWHDFIGFTPDNNTSDLGWITINHEMVSSDDKIGDGGGMTVFKVRRDPNNDTLIIINQTLEDGRKGKFFNIDFVNTVGETGMNCGGISSIIDGRIWTAEEWWRASNANLFENGTGLRDTSDWTIKSDINGDFNGQQIKRFENFNYMVEVDPRTAKAVRKQYNWGRQPFEGGTILADNRTVILGADETPALLTKFVADTPGDFTKGKTYVFKQNPNSYKGEWMEIDNTKLDNMLNIQTLAFQNGATAFNRLEWVAFDKNSGMVYLTETGRDNPGSRLKKGVDLGGAVAYHHKERAEEQGTDALNSAYWDYYGRVLVLNPQTNEVKPFLEGGPFYAGMDAEEPQYEPYPEKHLSNPDGLHIMEINGDSYMVICEDLNGTSFGRVQIGVANSTCELWMLDLQKEAKIENLVRIGVMPLGAEVTGVNSTPDGKTLLVDCQHPLPTNPFPYNNSLTYAITGWDKAITSVMEGKVNFGNDFKIWPNPATRELHFENNTDAAIYDINGNRVKVIRNASVVDVRDLSAGTYFVRTADNKGQKLIIQ
jgi:secreted PhoX family phosphatase